VRGDFARLREGLPRELDGLKLDHVVEARHESFDDLAFVTLLREAGVSAAFTDAKTWPSIADLTGEVVYARLQQGDDALEAAYPQKELDAWADRAKTWAKGGAPSDLPLIDVAHRPDAKPRDVFIYFIHEGKLRAPAAALTLIERLA
jgi:uncharacterized protein YecE (DUF72 family)